MAFPDGFEVPQDQGGPGRGQPIGGFGGDPSKSQDEHQAAVQSIGKAPVILLHGNAGAADLGRWNMLDLQQMLKGRLSERSDLGTKLFRNGDTRSTDPTHK
jgi:hypothetical protein